MGRRQNTTLHLIRGSQPLQLRLVRSTTLSAFSASKMQPRVACYMTLPRYAFPYISNTLLTIYLKATSSQQIILSIGQSIATRSDLRQLMDLVHQQNTLLADLKQLSYQTYTLSDAQLVCHILFRTVLRLTDVVSGCDQGDHTPFPHPPHHVLRYTHCELCHRKSSLKYPNHQLGNPHGLYRSILSETNMRSNYTWKVSSRNLSSSLRFGSPSNLCRTASAVPGANQ